MFPLSTLLLENEHQVSGYLTTERGWFPLSMAASLRMKGCAWFPLPPENKRAHFPLVRVAISVLTTLSGEATQVGLALHIGEVNLSHCICWGEEGSLFRL